jgi:hypothetical protein
MREDDQREAARGRTRIPDGVLHGLRKAGKHLVAIPGAVSEVGARMCGVGRVPDFDGDRTVAIGVDETVVRTPTG